MATKKRIDPHLRTFGARVKRFREEAGLSQAEAAKLVAVTRSYVGQVERGITRCRRDFSERLGEALGRKDEVAEAWGDLVRSAKYPQYFEDYASLEGTAVMLRHYSSDVVDGLLQVESYARALLRTESSLQARLKRQETLVRDPAPMACFILDESVLHRQVGTREVMKDQLTYLYEVSSREKICLQIAPTAYYRSVSGSFCIATQDDRDEAAYAASAFGGETSEEAEHLALVNEAFANLQARARNVADSRAHIGKVLEAKWM
ncbi:helix-turn-helix domain-containing protein [Actinomadura oligospora]|uniref:helix-turn-helix domain-containing protein n=1 Tax=Actinomadura oligospora TaxID=111804 RepID=UPI00047CA891|nr:helix-turn-helix transcriptional regulator [Actinomadura oligospora]